MSITDFTLEELLAVAVSKEIQDGELSFIGMGTGGRSFILAVGIPAVASRLAQLTHAPKSSYMFGPVINPDISKPPLCEKDFATWRCFSLLPAEDCLSAFKRGDVDIGFISAAQIDQHGNTNTVAIGNYNKPKVRLVGCIAQTDHSAYTQRTIILMNHIKRSFVENVDFITGAGYLNGKKNARTNAGMRDRGGPAKVFTNLGVFNFNSEKHEMQIESIHPGVTIEQVQDNTGFPLEISNPIPFTKNPKKKQIDLIRTIIDPESMWLNAKLTGQYVSLKE